MRFKCLWCLWRKKDCLVYLTYNTTFFNSHRHDCSTVAGMILQQSLARLLNSHWHKYATVAGTILQQSLVRLFNCSWYDCSTVTGTIVQQSLARFFNSHGQDFCFFYAGRILQQWCSLLKNRALHQEYDTWSGLPYLSQGSMVLSQLQLASLLIL